VCWALAGVNYFVMQVVVQSAWRTRYSVLRNPISDLGARHCAVSKLSGYVCSPWHAAMNVSFVLTGLLILLGTLGIVRRDAGSAGFLALGALGWVIVGSVPSDVELPIHNFGALFTFVFSNVGLLCYFRRQGPSVLAVSGAVGLIGFVVLLGVLPHLHQFGKEINGAVERVTAWPFPLTVAIYGLLQLRAVGGRQRSLTLPELR
jgi:hypothetical membrane protein